jgi:hypothetical protein
LLVSAPVEETKEREMEERNGKNGREREVLSFFLAFTERRKRKNIISVPPPVPEYLFFFY